MFSRNSGMLTLHVWIWPMGSRGTGGGLERRGSFEQLARGQGAALRFWLGDGEDRELGGGVGAGGGGCGPAGVVGAGTGASMVAWVRGWIPLLWLPGVVRGVTGLWNTGLVLTAKRNSERSAWMVSLRCWPRWGLTAPATSARVTWRSWS